MEQVEYARDPSNFITKKSKPVVRALSIKNMRNPGAYYLVLHLTFGIVLTCLFAETKIVRELLKSVKTLNVTKEQWALQKFYYTLFFKLYEPDKLVNNSLKLILLKHFIII